MIRQLFVAVVAVGTLAGATAGSASAAVGIDPTDVTNQWLLTPKEEKAKLTFYCFPCLVPDSVAGYDNRYDGDATPPVVEAAILGPSFNKTEQANMNIGIDYFTGNTQYIVIKQDGSSFFFERIGGPGVITFRFIDDVASHVSATPVPAALGLLLTGLAGLFGLKRYRQRQGDGAVPA